MSALAFPEPRPDQAPRPPTLDIDYTAFSASLGLDLKTPERSSRTIRSLPRSRALIMLCSAIGLFGLFQPALALMGVSVVAFVVFALLVAWRCWLILVATTPGFRRKPLKAPSERGLPVYSILIALYREGDTISGLARSLRDMDWPGDRKDVILLTETGDLRTLAAIDRAAWPTGTRVMTLPPGAPRTKPRALNYGLAHAAGRYVCVYDAEDRPHPAQFRAAHAAFLAGGDTLACVQAPLAGDNHRQSWLALQWTLEYAVQFGLFLPALDRLGLPLLLGGTSNHFRKTCLSDAGAWDAWNVTEDADLGVRLSAKGLKISTISPPTFEEAPETLGVWTAQRSRWLKGFLQTWMVMMHQPVRSYGELGPFSFLSLQIGLIGTCLAAFAHGPLLVLSVFAMALGVQLPTIAWGLMAAGYGVNVLAVLITPGPKRMQRWLGAATLPLYWPLQSVAATRALYEFVRRPHYWAKTPHGITAAVR
ncbi:MAG: glycosyltransferase [Pseudomonadota bacterium]